MTDQMSAELRAMVEIEGALKDLGDEERSRVMQWAAARFRTPVKTATVKAGASAAIEADAGNDEYPDLATFFSAANPSSDAEKALVGAYWMQYREDAPDIETLTVNTKLKHLGHGIGNATRAFDSLKSEKPALIVQTKKDGSTKQARKKFKVTNEGKKKVEAMLQREN